MLFLSTFFSIKLYLGSFFSRTFNSENASIAPLPIQKLVEEKGGTIAIREYLLQPNTTYYARAKIDTLDLTSTRPVISMGEVIEQKESAHLTKQVLEISDRPFTSPKPPRKPTPAYADQHTHNHSLLQPAVLIPSDTQE